MNFRFTARDNRASGGGTANAASQVTVVATAGPFTVTQPNTAISWSGGSSQTITWNVAGTTAAPISAANVKISLSIDGGNNFSTVLAASTPNDGSQAVTIPNTPTTTARIKVEAVGNIFFDISNTNSPLPPVHLPLPLQLPRLIQQVAYRLLSVPMTLAASEMAQHSSPGPIISTLPSV
jgi:hypothetical protein